MALRIAGAKAAPPPPPEEDTPPPDMPDPGADPSSEPYDAGLEPDDTGKDVGAGSGVVDPDIAGYQGPDQGPFMCNNCVHFGIAAPNTCEIVSGPIDELGCCNLFSSAKKAEPGTDDTDQASPDQEAPIPGDTEQTPLA